MNRVIAPDGTAIAWTSAGVPTEHTLVLVHSLGGDSKMWRDQVEGLGDDHRLVIVDVRGHGRSDAPPGPYSLETLGGDIVAAVDAAEVGEFSICGLSLGGLIAMWVTIHHAHRVRSLIASNTAAKVGTAAGWGERIRMVGAEGMAGIADRVVGNWFSPGFAGRDPDRWAQALAAFLATDQGGYIGCCAALATADLRGDVGSIAVPTLIIGGELDPSTPPVDAEWLHDRIAGSQLKILPGAAHLTNLEQPQSFTASVREFLR